MKIIKPGHNAIRQVRHRRVRAAVSGTAEKPRLSVFRSLKGLVAQLIDDEAGKTICYADSHSVKGTVEGKKGKVAVGFLIGQELAARAKAKGVTQVVFDRGGYAFHGRIAAVAEGARSGGLEF